MTKVKLYDTGKVVEVSPNVAFGLVDSGKATTDLKVYVPPKQDMTKKPVPPKNKTEIKKLEIERDMAKQFYKDRQMTTGTYKTK